MIHNHNGAGRSHRSHRSMADRFASPTTGAILGLMVAVLIVANLAVSGIR